MCASPVHKNNLKIQYFVRKTRKPFLLKCLSVTQGSSLLLCFLSPSIMIMSHPRRTPTFIGKAFKGHHLSEFSCGFHDTFDHSPFLMGSLIQDPRVLNISFNKTPIMCSSSIFLHQPFVLSSLFPLEKSSSLVSQATR